MSHTYGIADLAEDVPYVWHSSSRRGCPILMAQLTYGGQRTGGARQGAEFAEEETQGIRRLPPADTNGVF
ncbi:hypothetical protein CBR_g66943 [Chara braunii]|uniref:Uncharacterized protein n=1 Tax=Chara braunii TaxID=69332 RepID=A0A388MFW0_CHABU|nr:hypothetical protein CBR_g66943 [Chara braunii]|eukprot:GBG93365.1 hypothetical protein CBR_g66943 [Chara braunii]